jgi:tetratricopeptide (TPR) repeat protein
VYLTELGDWAGALAIYEKVLAARNPDESAAEDVVLWMEMGRLYHLTEKYDKAAERLARVIDALDHPRRFGLDESFKKVVLASPAMAYGLMGESFLLAGQHERAADAFQRAHRAAPNKGLLGYNLARIDARTGKPGQALDKLEEYFHQRLATEGLGPYRLLAEILKAQGKAGELVGRLEKLQAGDSADVPLGYFLAEKYLEADRLDKAEALYRTLVTKAPTTVGFRSLAAIYRKTRRYDDLLKVLGDTLAGAGSLDPAGENSRPLAGDGELVRGVIDAARARAKSGPKVLHYEAQVAVALLAMEAKQFDTAGEFFELAAKTRPDQAARLWLAWGGKLVISEQYARAVEVFRRGIDGKVSPGDPEFFYYLAGALEMSGRTDEALVAARTAVELASKPVSPADPKRRPDGQPGEQPDPKSSSGAKRDGKDVPGYQLRDGWILYHAKRHDDAEKVYRGLLDKYGADHGSNETRYVLREARLALSNVAVVRGETSAAIEWLEQVLDEFPDDVSALNDLGYLWAEQGSHLGRAHWMIEKAVREEPDNAAYRDSLGWVLFQLGRVPEALVELEKAAAKEPDPTVLEHLGDARRAAGRLDQAKESWRGAAKAYRKAGEIDKARRVEGKAAAPP